MAKTKMERYYAILNEDTDEELLDDYELMLEIFGIDAPNRKVVAAAQQLIKDRNLEKQAQERRNKYVANSK